MKKHITFLHGMWWTGKVFKDWEEVTRIRGYETKVLSLPNHETDNELVGKHSLVDYIKYTKPNLRDGTVLLGQSMGGLIGQRAANDCNVRAVVSVCSPPPAGILFPFSVLPAIIKHAIPVLTAAPFLPRKSDAKKLVFSDFSDEDFEREYQNLVMESGRAARAILLWGPGSWVRKNSQPTLVVAGENDGLTPLSVQKKIAVKHGAELYIVKNGSHALMLQKNRKQIMDTILDKLEDMV